MAQFEPFNLGNVLTQAENINQLRANRDPNSTRNQLLQQQLTNAQQQGQQRQQTFERGQSVLSDAELSDSIVRLDLVARDPSQAANNLDVLKQRGILNENVSLQGAQPEQISQIATELSGILKQSTGTKKGSQPSAVKEFQFFQGLSKKDQDRFLKVKRADPSLIKIDKGNSIALVNRSTSEPVAEFEKDVTIQDKLNKQKLADSKNKAKVRQQKVDMRKTAKNAKSLIVEGKIDEAIALTDKWFTTGFLGGILANIGGTDARNLKGTIDTIQGNIGFAELQAMRDASPTGGALGQVAVRELELLQSTLASLDQSQDTDVLLRNLEQVRTHIQNWKQAVDQSASEGGQQQAEPQQGKVLNFDAQGNLIQ